MNIKYIVLVIMVILLYVFLKKKNIPDSQLTVEQISSKYGWDKSQSMTYLKQLQK